jgi:hypothetical protein
MSKRPPRWLRSFLLFGMVGPIVIILSLLVYDVHHSEGWAGSESGPAWLGVFMFSPMLVIIGMMEIRAFLRHDREVYGALAICCAFGMGIFLLGLGGFLFVWLGITEGVLYADGILFLSISWAYLLLMALAHGWMYRSLSKNPESFTGEKNQ